MWTKTPQLCCYSYVNRIRSFLKNNISFSKKDSLVTLSILSLTFFICFALKLIDHGDNYVSMIFVLAVFLVSRFTDGYLYGVVSSVLAVLGVNYAFTYPYFAFNFTLEGYPLTIISMLVVSIITCTLTSQVKWQEKMKLENEREKMRANLLRSVSHDLRTPLTSILGATSTVAENIDTMSAQDQLKLLKGAQEDTQWLIRMVENLLTVTRMDDNKGTLKIVKVEQPAEEVITVSVTKFRKLFPYPPVNIRIPADPVFVSMDPLLIEQVLLNLLENAAIHSRDATWISLDLEVRNGKAVFSVIDNGIGIKADQIAKRTIPGDSSSKEGKRGFGIGLTVCQTIIAAHEGKMSLRDREGGGTIASFTLDLGDENEQ